MNYLQKLQHRISTLDSHLCVGLDPRPELIDGPIKDFLFHVIDETLPFAAAYKPNMAYFESLGLEGYRILEDTLARIPEEVPVVLDAKRGDIGETQRYYAKACFDILGVDAVTVNPLMGYETLEPFLHYPDKGIYVLALTSNPGADDFLTQSLGGVPIYSHILNWHVRAQNMGFVVGLTRLDEERAKEIPDVPLLMPGLGAQGGQLEALDTTHRQAPYLINASRSILYGAESRCGERAQQVRDQIRNAG